MRDTRRKLTPADETRVHSAPPSPPASLRSRKTGRREGRADGRPLPRSHRGSVAVSSSCDRDDAERARHTGLAHHPVPREENGFVAPRSIEGIVGIYGHENIRQPERVHAERRIDLLSVSVGDAHVEPGGERPALGAFEIAEHLYELFSGYDDGPPPGRPVPNPMKERPRSKSVDTFRMSRPSRPSALRPTYVSVEPPRIENCKAAFGQRFFQEDRDHGELPHRCCRFGASQRATRKPRGRITSGDQRVVPIVGWTEVDRLRTPPSRRSCDLLENHRRSNHGFEPFAGRAPEANAVAIREFEQADGIGDVIGRDLGPCGERGCGKTRSHGRRRRGRCGLFGPGESIEESHAGQFSAQTRAALRAKVAWFPLVSRARRKRSEASA